MSHTTGGLSTAFGADTYVDTYGAGVTAYAGAVRIEYDKKIE